MHDPCIHLLNKKSNALFNKNGMVFKSEKSKKTFDYDFVFNLVNNNWTILIFEMDFTNTNQLIKFLKTNKIKKIAFVINDVFRVSHKNKFIPPMSVGFIQNDLKNVVLNEIEIIKDIIKKTGIVEYKVYHCEIIPKYIQDFMNLDINYYDLYLFQWIRHYRKHVLISHCDDFKYKVSSFNKRYDEYRVILTALLHEDDKFYYTLCQTDPLDRFFKNKHFSIDLFESNFKEHLKKQCKKLYKKSFVNLHTEDSWDSVLTTKIQNSFLHLINETRFCSPMQNISEKSIRPIIAKRPFILAGAPGSLKLLKSLGFKTFDQWWCEDYDKEKNHHKRLIMIYKLVDSILNKDDIELKQMLKEMNLILEHNYQIYLNFKTEIYQTI
jgi:hypothetical protein